MIKSRFNILFLIIFTFCTEKKQSNRIEFDENDLSSIKLISRKITFNEIMDPRMIGFKDDLLYVMESNRTSVEVPAIHIIDTQNWIYSNGKGVKGHGPFELAGASTFLPGNNSDSFWVYSAQDKKFLEYHIHDSSQLAINEFKQPEIVYKVVKISQSTDSTFLGISVDDPNKILEFNKAGQKFGGYGTYEKIPNHPNLTNFQLFKLNTGWFKGDQDLGLHVKACIFRDRLEIFNFQTKDFISVEGPNLNLPTFELIGDDLYIPLDKNPYTYRDISFTKDYIFALYGGIGEFEYRETSKIAEKIYVFTHKGAPVTLLELDVSIGGLTVDAKKNKIYGFTTDENPGIAVFDLPKELKGL